MRATVTGLLIALILALTASTMLASGSVGIYALVSKVVLEPNDQTPERIQIWGAFTFVDGGTGSSGKTLTPRRGYLYFELPSADGAPYARNVALREWADFKAIAGTGQAVAFGRFGYLGVFSEELITCMPLSATYSNRCRLDENVIRGESTVPSLPSGYPMNIGLTKLSSTGDLAAVVKQLQDTLKK